MIYFGSKAKSILINNLDDYGYSNSTGIYKDNDIWIAFDNRTEHCNVEEFDSLIKAVAWIILYDEIDDFEEFSAYKFCNEFYLIPSVGVLRVKRLHDFISTSFVSF